MNNSGKQYLHPKEALDREFEQTKTLLLAAASSEEIDKEDFAKSVETATNRAIQSVKGTLGIVDLLKQKAANSIKELAEVSAHFSRLAAERRAYRDNGKKGIALYVIAYIFLLAASIAIFASTWLVIQPELPLYVGVLQSISMIAPSFMINYAYQRSTGKDRFLKYLHTIGLVSSVMVGVGIATAKAFIVYLLNKATGGSFLSGVADVTWLENLQLIVSTVTFIAAVFCEATLGGRLAIHIIEARESQRPLEQLDMDLNQARTDKERLEDETEELSILIQEMSDFDKLAKAWIEEVKYYMMVEFHAAQERLKTRTKNRAIKEMDKLSVGDMRSKYNTDDEEEDDDDD